MKRKVVFAVAALAVAFCWLVFHNAPQPDQSGQQGTVDGSAMSEPGATPVVETDRDSHREMVRLLAKLREQTADVDPYLGDAEVRQMVEAAKNLPANVAETDRCGLYFQLGQAELRLGRESDAIEHLTEATRLAEIPAVRSQMDEPAMAQFLLGVAWMRVAESKNCCQRTTPDSCIFPVEGQGIHVDKEPSEAAAECFTNVLRTTTEESDLHLQARWLLNIACMTLGDYPDGVPQEFLIPPAAFKSAESLPRFVNVGGQLGINTFSMCGGAIADDFDGDGSVDLVVSSWSLDGQIRFFRNDQDGGFTDCSDAAGLTGITGGLNLVQADFDNDGHLDFLVLRGGWLSRAGAQPNSLIRNNGDGTFVDVTMISGLAAVHYPTQTASWADYDLDGDLDLYVGNETAGGVSAPCQLFNNQGDGSFRDVAAKAGVTNDTFTKAVVWGDYDSDGWPDLYVSNLGEDNRLYRNDQDGTFTDHAESTGLTGPHESFPAWFWDFNNDGHLDIYVAAYSTSLQSIAGSYLGRVPGHELACLYRGDGKGQFKDVAKETGLTRPSLPMGANFGDLDNDGFLDFYLGTGDPEYATLTPNIMYRNRNGDSFADVTTAGGFGHLQKGHAVVFADFDNDGDQDIFEQLGGAYPGDRFFDALYENPGFPGHWLSVRLIGAESSRSAIGARLRVDVSSNGTTRSIFKHVNSGGSFGANPFRQTIGLGDADMVERLEVSWPGRATQVWQNIAADRALTILEGAATYSELPLRRSRPGNAPRESE
jgi:hypothetical protein